MAEKIQQTKPKSKKLKKNDFVQLEYTGRVKDTGIIFDTNIKEEAKKINLDIKTKQFIICIGQGMILSSIDEFLINKEIGKTYNLELKPEKAFGNRSRDLIKTMPISVFQKQNISLQPGMVFSFDNALGKISAVSGGRVIVDFNNPVAGKEVVYELKIKRKILDEEKKIKILMKAFFRKEFEFEIKEKKLEIKVQKEYKKFVEIFKEKFKEILGLELKVESEK